MDILKLISASLLFISGVPACAVDVDEPISTEGEALTTFNAVLPSGARLFRGDKLVAARGGPRSETLQTNVYLVMQTDCNLVVYSNGTPVWHTNTVTPGALNCYAVMQGDGNFVLYINGTARWHTGTVGSPGAEVRLVYWGSGYQSMSLYHWNPRATFCIFDDSANPCPHRWIRY